MRLINNFEVSNTHKDRKKNLQKKFSLIHDRNITVHKSKIKRSLKFDTGSQLIRVTRRAGVAVKLVSTLNVASGGICLIAGYMVLPTITSGGALAPIEATLAAACSISAAAGAITSGILSYFDIS